MLCLIEKNVENDLWTASISIRPKNQKYWDEIAFLENVSLIEAKKWLKVTKNEREGNENNNWLLSTSHNLLFIFFFILCYKISLLVTNSLLRGRLNLGIQN